jgi:hypothetical protein
MAVGGAECEASGPPFLRIRPAVPSHPARRSFASGPPFPEHRAGCFAFGPSNDNTVALGSRPLSVAVAPGGVYNRAPVG